jgi:hypothetical protein
MRKIVIHDLKFREALLTNRAFQDVHSLLLMRLHMFVEIRFLSKGVFAAMGDADEGLLMRVRSKVIKQIVPFFKQLLAGRNFAKEHLSPTFAFRLEILDVFESAETGQRDRPRDRSQIDIIAIFNLNVGPKRHPESGGNFFPTKDAVNILMAGCTGHIDFNKILSLSQGTLVEEQEV